MIRVIRAVVAIAAVLSVSACAFSRSEIALSETPRVANPADGIPVVIVRVI